MVRLNILLTRIIVISSVVFFHNASGQGAISSSGPFTNIFNVNEIRISGDPTDAIGSVSVHKTVYSALHCNPAWSLDNGVKQRMLENALSAMLTNQALTMSGTVNTVQSGGINFCWKIAETANY